jgi:FAD/FMN-containing dehydrogenase
LKVAQAMHYKSPVEVRLMRALKTALDPENLMNPAKVLPDVRAPGALRTPS